MSELKWETPDVARGKGMRGRWPAIIEQLKERPGEWAVVDEDASPNITTFLKSRYGVEAVARGVKNGRAERIYARWVG